MKTTADTMAQEPHYQAPPVNDADFTQLCNALLAMEDDDGADFDPLGLVGPGDGLAAHLSSPAAIDPKIDLPVRSEAHPMPLAPPLADAASPQPSLSVDSDVCFAALLDDGTPEVDPFRWPDGAEWLGARPMDPSQPQPSSEPLSPSPPATDAPPATLAASRAASPAESAGEANPAPASKRTKRARAPEAASEGGDSSGVSETRALGLDPPASLAEQRRQKRMAKNRRTAAESRERKKAAAAEAAREAAELREENARLKAALERAEARSRALEGQLASLTRGAGAESPAESPAPATTAKTTTTTTTAAAVEHMEPAEPQPNTAVSQLRTTTTDAITLPPVMPQPQLTWSSASPSSSSPELFTAWLLLSCVAMTCHAANSTLEALAQVVIQALRQHAGLPALLAADAVVADHDEVGGPTSGHQRARATLEVEPPSRPSRAPEIDSETARTRQLETSESLAENLVPLIPPAPAAISDRQLRALLQQCSSALLSRAPSAPPLAPLVC